MYEEDGVAAPVPDAARATRLPVRVVVHVNCRQSPVAVALPALQVLGRMCVFGSGGARRPPLVRHVVVHTLEPACRERYGGLIEHADEGVPSEGGAPWLSFTGLPALRNPARYNPRTGADVVTEAEAAATALLTNPLHWTTVHVYGEARTQWTEAAIQSMADEVNGHGVTGAAQTRHVFVSSPPKYLIGMEDGLHSALDAAILFGAIMVNVGLRLAAVTTVTFMRPFLWCMSCGFLSCCCDCFGGLRRAFRSSAYRALEHDAVHAVRWADAEPDVKRVDSFSLSSGGSLRVPLLATSFVRGGAVEDIPAAPQAEGHPPTQLSPSQLRATYIPIEQRDGTYDVLRGLTSRRWAACVVWALVYIVAWNTVVWWLHGMHVHLMGTTLPSVVDAWYQGLGDWARAHNVTLGEARAQFAAAPQVPVATAIISYTITMGLALCIGPFFYWPICACWVDFGVVRMRDGAVLYQNKGRVLSWLYMVLPSLGLAAYACAVVHCWLGRWACGAVLAGLTAWLLYSALDWAPVTLAHVGLLLALCCSQLWRKWGVDVRKV